MSGTTDVVKGRIKEAVGALTNDDKLREEGQADQAVGRVKQAAKSSLAHAKAVAQKAVDAAMETAKQAVNEAKEVAQKAVDEAQNVTNSTCG